MSLTPLAPERQHDLGYYQVESLDCIEPLGGNQSADDPNYGNPNHRLQRLFWPSETTNEFKSAAHRARARERAHKIVSEA